MSTLPKATNALHVESRSGVHDSCCLSRRGFMGGLAALGAGALLLGDRLLGQAGNPRRIDVHHHFTPQVYLDFTKKYNLSSGFGKWDLQADLEDMDKGGTATAILTITTPGFGQGHIEDTRTVVRKCNEEAAKLHSDYPKRFGSFAAIPITDTDGSLREIEYAFDTLKADGIGLFSNYGDKWLGHPSFAPVYEELNRRKAVTYVHPIVANCCVNLGTSIPNEGATVEFETDTTRTIGDLLFSGSMGKFPTMRWIFSHAGGTMPFLIERFLIGTAEEVVPGILTKGMTYAAPKNVPNGVLYELRRQFYDTAQSANPVDMEALRKIVPVSQILFGTDYWYRTATETGKGLTTCKVFNAEELHAIDRGNVERMMPQFKS